MTKERDAYAMFMSANGYNCLNRIKRLVIRIYSPYMYHHFRKKKYRQSARNYGFNSWTECTPYTKTVLPVYTDKREILHYQVVYFEAVTGIWLNP
jgi:hypothetical protein